MNQNNETPFPANAHANPYLNRHPIAALEGSVCLRNRTRDSLLASQVTIANTYFPRLIGLLGKGPDWASADRGLWIIPCHGVHMLGMRFAIDVIFLDRSRTVVHLHENLRPWRVSRVIRNARSVLELPVKTIATSHTQIGDEIEVVRSTAEGIVPSDFRTRPSVSKP